MSAFSESRIGNWTFTAYGVVLPLPSDLTNRVKLPVPNRSERRRAAREGLRAARRDQRAHTIAVAAAPQPDDPIGDVTNWQPTGVQQ